MKKHLLVICLALLTFAVQGAKAETYSDEDKNTLRRLNSEHATKQLETGDHFEYDGQGYTVIGKNLIENPTFDDGLTGWIGAAGGPLVGTTLNSNGGIDDGAYIIPYSFGGTTDDGSIGTAWEIEKGKTYVFSYFINNTDSSLGAVEKEGYIVTSQIDVPRKYDSYRTLTIMYGHEDAGGAWTQNIVVTEAQYNYLQFSARWLGGAHGFDAFILAEVVPDGDPTELITLCEECTEWLDYYDEPNEEAYDTFKAILTNAYTLAKEGGAKHTDIEFNAMVAILREALFDFRMACASHEHPLDVTGYYIENPDFGNGLEDWECSYIAIDGGANIRTKSYFQPVASRVLEINDPTQEVIVKQAINGLPKGYYIFSFDCVMTHNTSMENPNAETGAWFFCNGIEQIIKTEDMTDRNDFFDTSYPQRFMIRSVVADTSITVGFRVNDEFSASYVAIDNVKLEYCGKDNDFWTFDDESGKLIIHGEMPDYDYGGAPWNSIKEQIKSIELINITSIGSYAFSGCSSLTSVTIPNNVASIGNGAFSGCCNLTSVIIPINVVDIGNGAFSGCSNLASVNIPEDLTCINSYTFQGCSSLTSVTIPNSVTSIGFAAFSGCNNLVSITIPENVTNIGSYAFNGCGNLTTVTMERATPCTLGNSILTNCTSLHTINIPYSTYDAYKSSANWSDYANYFIESATITSKDGNITWSLDTSTGVLTLTGNGNMIDYDYVTRESSYLTAAPWGKFENDIKEIVIKPGVTNIGRYAFLGCIRLTSVTIPSSVTSIGESAFDSCSNLTNVTIPENVINLADYAFYGCSSLVDVTIPKGVKSIGRGAFQNCTSITNVTMLEGVTSIEYGSFAYCSSLATVAIPEGVKSIGEFVFYNCNDLTSVMMPNTITSIGASAFRGCKNLTDVAISEGISSIEDYTFYDCLNLAHVTIPEGVKGIGELAFYNCGNLASVTIPNTVTSIDTGAFYQCI